MLTSHDGDESRNFFSRLRIKLLKVEYWEWHQSQAYSMLYVQTFDSATHRADEYIATRRPLTKGY